MKEKYFWAYSFIIITVLLLIGFANGYYFGSHNTSDNFEYIETKIINEPCYEKSINNKLNIWGMNESQITNKTYFRVYSSLDLNSNVILFENISNEFILLDLNDKEIPECAKRKIYYEVKE